MTHSAAHGLLQIGIAALIVGILVVVKNWREFLYAVPVFAVVTVLVVGMGWVH